MCVVVVPRGQDNHILGALQLVFFASGVPLGEVRRALEGTWLVLGRRLTFQEGPQGSSGGSGWSLGVPGSSLGAFWAPQDDQQNIGAHFVGLGTAFGVSKVA